MTNRVHSFLAINVALEADTDFDESEEIETVPMPVTAVYQDLLSGRVLVQGLHLASLYAAAAFVRGLSDPLLTPFRDAIERAYKDR
jgi:hypothetical protein